MGENTDSGYINYSETRTINIGTYEHVKSSLTYGNKVRPVDRNGNFTLETTYQEIERLGEGKTFNDAAKLVVSRVKRVLDAREVDVRLKTSKFVDDFSQEEKILAQQLISLKRWREKKKRYEIAMDESKEYVKELDTSFEEDDFEGEV